MSRDKNKVLELIRRLPDDVTTEEIMEEIYFKQQVDKGLQDITEDRVLSHEELKQRIVRWRHPLVSNGRERPPDHRSIHSGGRLPVLD